jgi:hypothetical protein
MRIRAGCPPDDSDRRRQVANASGRRRVQPGVHAYDIRGAVAFFFLEDVLPSHHAFTRNRRSVHFIFIWLFAFAATHSALAPWMPLYLVSPVSCSLKSTTLTATMIYIMFFIIVIILYYIYPTKPSVIDIDL